jgi:mono/diheme cytochrome c family protein
MVWACGSALYLPTSATVSDPEELTSLQQGRKLYIDHCGSCHNLYKPDSYSKEKWTHQMQEMKVEAKISDAQADLILDYLTSAPTTKK